MSARRRVLVEACVDAIDAAMEAEWGGADRVELCGELLQGGVVLEGADDPAAARAVRDTLLSEPGRALLRRYGFSLPDSAG